MTKKQIIVKLHDRTELSYHASFNDVERGEQKYAYFYEDNHKFVIKDIHSELIAVFDADEVAAIYYLERIIISGGMKE